MMRSDHRMLASMLWMAAALVATVVLLRPNVASMAGTSGSLATVKPELSAAELRAQIEPLIVRYVQAWTAGDYNAMYRMLDEPSQAFMTPEAFRTRIGRNERAWGMPLRFIRIKPGTLIAFFYFQAAVEIPKTAQQDGLSVDNPNLRLTRQGYLTGSVGLIHETGGWGVVRLYLQGLEGARSRPVATATEWKEHGFGARIEEQLGRQVPLVPEPTGLDWGAYCAPGWHVASDYLRAWLRQDYRAMYTLGSQWTNAHFESESDFEAHMREAWSGLTPLFVSSALQPSYAMDTLLERRGGEVAVIKRGIGPEDTHQAPKGVELSRHDGKWRVNMGGTYHEWSEQLYGQPEPSPASDEGEEEGQSQAQAQGGGCCSGSSDTEGESEKEGQTGGGGCSSASEGQGESHSHAQEGGCRSGGSDTEGESKKEGQTGGGGCSSASQGQGESHAQAQEGGCCGESSDTEGQSDSEKEGQTGGCGCSSGK